MISVRTPQDAPPEHGWFARALMVVFLKIRSFPPWARPPAFGAVLLFIMTAFRGVFIVAFHPGLRSLGMFLIALIVASLAGALAGAAFVIVRLPLRLLGAVGDLLTGIVLCCVYLFGVLLPAKYWFHDDTLQTRGDWITAASIAVGFGVFVTIVYWHNVRKLKRSSGM